MTRRQWMLRTRTVSLGLPGQWGVGYRHPGDPGHYTILYRARTYTDCERWRRNSPAPAGDRPGSQETPT